jgi:hypothetical protein
VLPARAALGDDSHRREAELLVREVLLYDPHELHPQEMSNLVRGVRGT